MTTIGFSVFIGLAIGLAALLSPSIADCPKLKNRIRSKHKRQIVGAILALFLSTVGVFLILTFRERARNFLWYRIEVEEPKEDPFVPKNNIMNVKGTFWHWPGNRVWVLARGLEKSSGEVFRIKAPCKQLANNKYEFSCVVNYVGDPGSEATVGVYLVDDRAHKWLSAFEEQNIALSNWKYAVIPSPPNGVEVIWEIDVECPKPPE